jgi:hypothetical protein
MGDGGLAATARGVPDSSKLRHAVKVVDGMTRFVSEAWAALIPVLLSRGLALSRDWLSV